MKKQLKGFTLIELMVVVAVIAILATLGVSNFSAAIKRTRNAGRQSDVQAVAKALETCYDVPSGKYSSLGSSGIGSSVVAARDNPTSGPFAVDTNKCLNEDIVPDMVGYNYVAWWQGTSPQKFVVCAKLEEVANWEGIGNSNTSAFSTDAALKGSFTSCGSTGECYFCAKNQQ